MYTINIHISRRHRLVNPQQIPASDLRDDRSHSFQTNNYYFIYKLRFEIIGALAGQTAIIAWLMVASFAFRMAQNQIIIFGNNFIIIGTSLDCFELEFVSLRSRKLLIFSYRSIWKWGYLWLHFRSIRSFGYGMPLFFLNGYTTLWNDLCFFFFS